jgi:hypothetical protein
MSDHYTNSDPQQPRPRPDTAPETPTPDVATGDTVGPAGEPAGTPGTAAPGSAAPGTAAQDAARQEAADAAAPGAASGPDAAGAPDGAAAGHEAVGDANTDHVGSQPAPGADAAAQPAAEDGESALPANVPARSGDTSALTPVFHTRVLSEAGLSATDIEGLRQEYARGQMDLGQRAEKLRLDAVALEKAMDTLVEGSSKAHEKGLSVTTTHSRDSEVSKTEIVIGNTGKARGGHGRSGMRFGFWGVLGILVGVGVVGAIWWLSTLG